MDTRFRTDHGRDNDPDDKALVRDIQNGDAQAFKSLVMKYYSGLCNFAWQFVNISHTAEDLVQDVLANIWEKRNSWNPAPSADGVRTYLYRSVKNRALNHIRRRTDLIRHGKYIEYAQNRTYSSGAEAHHVLYPIPTDVIIEGDGKIEQNPGY